MKPSRHILLMLAVASLAACEHATAPVAPSSRPAASLRNVDGRIAFASTRNGSYKIFVMGEDGSGVTQLTPPAIWSDDDPVWSPDGTRIAFRSTRDGPYYDIWLMNADGS